MNSLFNEYNLKARLFPALLCSLPFLLIKHFVADVYIGDILNNTLFVVVVGDVSLAAVLSYLLAQINRFVSKILFEDKSKFPTIQILLPSNQVLSNEFRKKIERKVNDDFKLFLPDLVDEKVNIENTKIRIKEIISLIINKVGNGTLLLQHNIEYGFVRNLIGGSVIAAIISIGSSIIFSLVLKNNIAFALSIILSVCYLIPILFSKTILRNYSEEYAHILFREYIGS